LNSGNLDDSSLVSQIDSVLTFHLTHHERFPSSKNQRDQSSAFLISLGSFKNTTFFKLHTEYRIFLRCHRLKRFAVIPGVFGISPEIPGISGLASEFYEKNQNSKQLPLLFLIVDGSIGLSDYVNPFWPRILRSLLWNE
jgi:hypothetical protein